MRNLILWAVGFLAFSTVNAQILQVTPQTTSCALYQRVDVEVELQGEWENP